MKSRLGGRNSLCIADGTWRGIDREHLACQRPCRSPRLWGGFQSTSQHGRGREECSHPVRRTVPSEDLPRTPVQFDPRRTRRTGDRGCSTKRRAIRRRKFRPRERDQSSRVASRIPMGLPDSAHLLAFSRSLMKMPGWPSEDTISERGSVSRDEKSAQARTRKP
jgi:hypothetical protein